MKIKEIASFLKSMQHEMCARINIAEKNPENVKKKGKK